MDPEVAGSKPVTHPNFFNLIVGMVPTKVPTSSTVVWVGIVVDQSVDLQNRLSFPFIDPMGIKVDSYLESMSDLIASGRTLG